MKKIITYTLIVIVSFTFFSFKKNKTIKLETPPGTFKLDSNFFADIYEIRNVDYGEYTFWLKRVMGEESAEYLSALPDTTVWDNEINDKNIGAKYFRHIMYQEYPVVGVSYKQAVNFCKWRSERVNEMILVREGELLWNTEQNSNNYFTVNRFLSGKYKNYKNNDTGKPKHKKYNFVKYSLPTEKQWNYIQKKSEELFNKQKFSNRKIKKHTGCLKDGKPVQTIWSISSVVYYKETGIIKKSPTAPVFMSCFKQHFYNLQGNVAELTADNSIIGGSWKETEQQILEYKPIKFDKPTDYIGFRCVASWKEYNVE